MKKKTSLLLIVAFIIMINLVGCSKVEDRVIMTINDQEVMESEVVLYLSQIKTTYEYSFGSTDIWEIEIDGVTLEEFVIEEVKDIIIEAKISGYKAEEYNITLTEEEIKEINENVEIYMAMLSDKEKKIGVDRELVNQVFIQEEITRKVYEYVTEDFQVDEQLLEEYLNEDVDYLEVMDIVPEEYAKSVKVQMLTFPIINTDDSGEITVLDEEEKEELESLTKDILEEVKNGASFADIAADNEEEIIFEDLQIYKYQTTYFPEELINSIYDLKENEISDIIETSAGYTIVLVEEFLDATEEEIEEVADYKNQVEEDAISVYVEQQKITYFYELMDDWRKEFTIEINEEIWDEITIQ